MTHPSPLLFASRLLVLLLPLAGCGSTPSTDWYLLEATATPLPAAGGPSIGIARLEVADYLLAPQVQTHSGPNSVRRADFARWAEPLDQGDAGVLADGQHEAAAAHGGAVDGAAVGELGAREELG